ncbi:cytochrome P450 [Wolfiporia cocos MD-104 SS10]|uniref:Cytochrome P450 n=1 Tax=Wolfiporia cocos (strain MD-104) TaxID=742152 RepID=A0A2H3J4A3_WOLCO|nr:cytochrome P450 [Wolfiporia cocos MD-104 SS10]
MTAYSYFALPVVVAVLVLWKLIPLLLKPLSSKLRLVPGPPCPSWLFGNLKEITNVEAAVLHEQWVAAYGHTIKYKGWLGHDILYTMDTRALNHILSHSNDYQKPAIARFSLSEVLGEGILFAEGEQHRLQRRVMNPAFGPSQIREITDIFLEKAAQLRDMWLEEISVHGDSARVDVLDGMAKMTLDVIGLAGFNYSFDALNASGKANELNKAFQELFGKATNKPSIFAMLRYLIPPLRLIPTPPTRRVDAAVRVMRRIGMELVTEKKAEVIRDMRNPNEKQDGLRSRDLLTLLIKANMAVDLDPSQRLSDEDVLSQIPTFLSAGHETTSNATTWCMYALSQARDIQEKLRTELLAVPTDTPTMDELQALPYLDAVVRETMRVYAPVPATVRVAMKDDVIPLNTAYTDINGNEHDEIEIEEGIQIDIPIVALHRSKELWGDDALEFKPDRWGSLPEAAQNIPGVWGNLMTFLGGPRSCIGYRFSLIEMKALVFILIRAFEFELAVPAKDISKQSSAVQRPFVLSEPEKGTQLPLIIKPYRGL